MSKETQKSAEQIKVVLSEGEFQARAEHEGRTRQERLERLGTYVDDLFSGERQAGLRTQIRESFDVPQWGEYHNEGLLMDTHLSSIVERIEAICGSEAASKDTLEGLDPLIASKIQRAVTSDREMVLRYALLHDLEKRNTLGFNKKNEKGRRETKNVSWSEWQEMLASHPDPASLRAHFQDLKIDSIGYQEHGDKGAEVSTGFGIDTRIAKGIRFHELGFQADVKTGTIRSRGAIDAGDADFIIAVNFLDQSASFRKDGKGDTTAMLRVERILNNIGIIQAVESLYKGADLSNHDAEDVAKAVQTLELRSDAAERLADAEEEWSTIFEAHTLKRVDTEALARKMTELSAKKSLILEASTISALQATLSDPARRVQPEKAGSKVIFENISDKKLAAEVKATLKEALLEMGVK